jgi:tetratricopeptide (TPR) repeat protein
LAGKQAPCAARRQHARAVLGAGDRSRLRSATEHPSRALRYNGGMAFHRWTTPSSACYTAVDTAVFSFVPALRTGLLVAQLACVPGLATALASSETVPPGTAAHDDHGADIIDLRALLPPDLSAVDGAVAELVRQTYAEAEEAATSAEQQAALADALADLAMVYEANVLWPAAVRAWRAAMAASPAVPASWTFHYAIVLRETGDIASAADVLTSLARQHPQLAWVQERFGEALSEQGVLDGALGAYRQVVALAPDSPLGYVGQGDVLLQMQRYDEAIRSLERAAAMAPGYRQARYMLGLAYRGVGRLEEAALELQRGVDARRRYLDDPLTGELRRRTVNSPAVRNAAASMLASNQPDEAARLLEALLRRGSADIDDINNLAVAYMQLGRTDESRRLLEQSAALIPDRFSTQLNLASLALRERDASRAMTHARRAVALAPDVARTHVMLARVAAAQGDWTTAEQSLSAAERLDSRDPQVAAMHGDVLLRLGQRDAAVARFAHALTLWPDFLPAQVSLANLYLSAGDQAAARAMYERARSLAPDHPAVRQLGERLPTATADPES